MYSLSNISHRNKMTEEYSLSDGVNNEEQNGDSLRTSPLSSVDLEEELYENVKEYQDRTRTASLQMAMTECRMMLLGRRGAGKSSTGNTILGCHAFNTDMQLARVTKFCEKMVGYVDGRQVAVIDTPGLIKTKRMEKEVIRNIMKSITLYKPGPHVFLLVLPVGNLTNEDKDMHRLIENMFGKSVWRFTIILFTHGDRLEDKTPNEVIASSDLDLREFIRRCSGGFHFFNNKDWDNRNQVSELLKKVETLMAINGRDCYVAALYPPSERKIRERQERILEEREDEILRKERELEENYEDKEELERQKRELWREEEEDARKVAENEPKHKVNIKKTPTTFRSSRLSLLSK